MPHRNPEGRGVLFPNNDENPHPKAPGYRGRATLNGCEYQISAWVNTAGKDSKHPGTKYLSLKFDEEQPADEQKHDERQPQGGEKFF